MTGAAPVPDNPIWAALTGPHAAFGEVRGRAGRHDRAVRPYVDPPPGRVTRWRADGVQLVGAGVRGAPALRLYERLGFVSRARVVFSVQRTPA